MTASDQPVADTRSPRQKQVEQLFDVVHALRGRLELAEGRIAWLEGRVACLEARPNEPKGPEHAEV